MSDGVVAAPEEKVAEKSAVTLNEGQVEVTAAAGVATMHIKVYSPFKVYFDEEGQSISGSNATGPFDILPRHHNFMTLLEPCELLIRKLSGSEQRIRISGGLMHVKSNRVTVFLDI